MDLIQARKDNYSRYLENKKLAIFHNVCITDFSTIINNFVLFNDKKEENTNIGVTPITSFGRVIFVRKIGKISFVKVRRGASEIQLVFRKSSIDDFELLSCVDILDIIAFDGDIGYSSTGEVSVFVKNWKIQTKCFQPPPEKYLGLTDANTIYNKRYIDLLSNLDSVKVFQNNAKIKSKLRKYLELSGLIEVDTGILTNQVSGATAKPFDTHHNASNSNPHLRISPELNLKKCLVGGLSEIGVFEFAQCFRNEGIDSTHSPNFELLEIYEFCNSDSVKSNFDYLISKLNSIISLFFQEQVVYWSFKDDLSQTLKELNLSQDICPEDCQDVFDNLIEPYLLNLHEDKILFVLHHPNSFSPLAKEFDEIFSARTEVYYKGMEIINAYCEQDCPIKQKQAFEKQGVVDLDYIQALEFGLAPTIGIGIGIQRLLMLLNDKKNIKDVILFPY